MEKSKSKFSFLTFIGIILAVTLIVASIIYLLTDRMIPGLIPLCTAAMMLPLWLQQKQSKFVSILLIAAAVLNVIAGVLQIFTALYP